jgi:hypothetical protein
MINPQSDDNSFTTPDASTNPPTTNTAIQAQGTLLTSKSHSATSLHPFFDLQTNDLHNLQLSFSLI